MLSVSATPPQSDDRSVQNAPPQKILVGAPPIALAYRRRPAQGPGADRPGLVWLGGFRSDMLSAKAACLDERADAGGRAFLRFDYSGHGESDGDFEQGTIGVWSRQSLEIVRALTCGPQILVGSSMGAWIALLVARALAAVGESARLAGLVLIAPAVDFTETLLWSRLPASARKSIEQQGRWLRPSDYSPEPYPITRALIEDGRNHLLLDGEIHVGCPVHILQGMQDPDVPWRHALALVEHLAHDPATLTLIKDGDHRLSREEDLRRLLAAVEAIA
jgi:pimeloyl-ACP methyl ester carboxylesterase